MIQVTGSNSLDEAPSKRGTKDHWLACHTQAQTKAPPTSDVFVASNKTLFANRGACVFFCHKQTREVMLLYISKRRLLCVEENKQERGIAQPPPCPSQLSKINKKYTRHDEGRIPIFVGPGK